MQTCSAGGLKKMARKSETGCFSLLNQSGFHFLMDPEVVKLLHTQLDEAKSQADSWKAKEEAAKKKYDEMINLAKQNVEALESEIIFNVGGKLFLTTKDTLMRVKDSYFTSMIESGHWKPRKDGTYFIDRNATCFGRILDYMRYDELDMEGLTPTLKKMLQKDFDYFFPKAKPVKVTPINLCSNHMDVLQSWLGDHFDSTKLLWRGSTDGFTPKAFHDRCDKKGPTLTVIKSANDWIFGGFNPENWTSKGVYSEGSGAFLFTLTNPHGIPPTQYFCHHQDYVTHNEATSGPVFGDGHDLAVWSDDECYTDFPFSYKDTTGFGDVTFTGKRAFGVKEIEVFAIS